jgi:hypothetical protein
VAAFDEPDEHLVYARLISGTSRVAIRSLATQTERELNLHGETVWQVQREGGSEWMWLPRIRAYVPPRLASWPRLVTTATAGNSCSGVDSNSLGMVTNAIASGWLRADTGELRADRPALENDGPAADTATLASFGVHALSMPAGSYQITNTETGTITALPGLVGHVSWQAYNIIAIDHAIVDLATARVLGEVAIGPLAVDVTNRVLVSTDCRDCEVAMGPLHWELVVPNAAVHDAAPTDAALRPAR